MAACRPDVIKLLGTEPKVCPTKFHNVMMRTTTDCLLIQAICTRDLAQKITHSDAWLSLPAQTPELHALHARGVWSDAQQALYLYLELVAASQVHTETVRSLETSLTLRFAQAKDIQVSRLSKVFDRAGASSRAQPGCHYVVETDPEDGWMEEIGRWYDEEHMPGLASVSGSVRASRYLNHDHGPASYACYDLVSPDVLGCADWLAVRHTDWSSRARPHFSNTKRTMFELLA